MSEDTDGYDRPTGKYQGWPPPAKNCNRADCQCDGCSCDELWVNALDGSPTTCGCSCCN
tara:strand:- start:333 stop:509 length:177 start_codon:yes stop_codon:yes gene_type:complete